RSRIANEIPQHQFEVVALQRAALELATDAFRADDFESLSRDTEPIRDRRARRHGERLLGHCIPVLQSSKANIARRYLANTRQLLRDPHRVRAALANLQQQVIAVAIGAEAEPLANDEIFGHRT